mgnify:CR=1 FL=1
MEEEELLTRIGAGNDLTIDDITSEGEDQMIFLKNSVMNSRASRSESELVGNLELWNEDEKENLFSDISHSGIPLFKRSLVQKKNLLQIGQLIYHYEYMVTGIGTHTWLIISF